MIIAEEVQGVVVVQDLDGVGEGEELLGADLLDLLRISISLSLSIIVNISISSISSVISIIIIIIIVIIIIFM